MKRLLTAILALTMAFALAVPAFAAPRGRGYTDGSVKVNGYSYSVRVQILSDLSHNVYTKCTTTANVRRVHNNDIRFTYLTAHDGYFKGGPGGFRDTLQKQIGESVSDDVEFKLDTDDFVSIIGMGGSVTLCGDTATQITASVN